MFGATATPAFGGAPASTPAFGGGFGGGGNAFATPAPASSAGGGLFGAAPAGTLPSIIHVWTRAPPSPRLPSSLNTCDAHTARAASIHTPRGGAPKDHFFFFFLNPAPRRMTITPLSPLRTSASARDTSDLASDTLISLSSSRPSPPPLLLVPFSPLNSHFLSLSLSFSFSFFP